MIKGIEMAVRDINAAGGVNGEQVTIVGGDEGDDPVGRRSERRSAAEHREGRRADRPRVVDDGAPACSDASPARACSTCSPSNTALALEQFPDDGYYVRTAPSDRLQGVALAEVIAEGGYRTVALMSPNDDYGRGMADVLVDQLPRQRHPGDDQLPVRPERHQLRARRAASARDRSRRRSR